jgi:cyclomaltodextrinase
MSVPYWVQDAVFYHIFPDRFANGDTSNDPPNTQPWGALPNRWDFQGGDLRGIIQKLDYLLDLGITALYLNPIFLANSNHRYNTADYFQIDPRLGKLDDFHALLKAAQTNGIRIILDGVFNHCGRGFFPFVDVLENQQHSAYQDWFHIKQFPVQAYSPDKSETYLGWWGLNSLPKLNTDNIHVRRYLLDVARYWIEQGIDGWRLDVPNEINDDSFWAEFRHVVKAANQDAYLVGEIWTVDPRWVGENHFDGLMNYPVRDALLDLLNGEDTTVSTFADRIELVLSTYPRENAHAMYLLLGSHDTERLLTILNGSLEKVKLAFAFLFAYPGAPAVYYGDEIGLNGGKDPGCRGAFPWDEAHWNRDLHQWITNLIALRKLHPAMRRGEFHRLLVDNQNRCYAFSRSMAEEHVLCVLNASSMERQLQIPVIKMGWEDGRILHNLLGKETYSISTGQLTFNLPPLTAVWVG